MRALVPDHDLGEAGDFNGWLESIEFIKSISRINFITGVGASVGALATLNISGYGGSEDSGTTPQWNAGNSRNKIVIISDLLLGIDDRYSEMKENRPLLIKFLQSLQNTKDVRERVIAGDFLDEWYLPIYYYPLRIRTSFTGM